MFKKICSLFILIICLFGFSSITIANEIEEDVDYVWLQEEISKSKEETNNINIYSKTAVVYDRTSQSIIFGKNENEKVKMASTTKIMTAIVFLENVKDLNSTVEVCKTAANVGGSRLGLKTGDKITYNDLLYGLLLCSGNDCAIQIAVSTAGSVQNFAELMNNKAKELNLTSTHFVTPHGLDEDEHYTTALELAKMADYALNISKFAEVVSTKNYTVTINGYSKQISNTNELLGYLDGVNGVKTGFTNGAGRCLVTSVNRNNFNIITVVLGADTKKIRTKDSIKLIEYTYSNYHLVDLKPIIQENFENWLNINKNRIYINKASTNDINLALKSNSFSYYPVKNGEDDKIKIEINSVKYIEAPIAENELIGGLIIKLNGKEIGSIDILNKNEIKKKNVLEYIRLCFKLLYTGTL
jgi:D-alanyl-D-alanine carboxypeptidase (penicillin-binding protein 5/6)